MRKAVLLLLLLLGSVVQAQRPNRLKVGLALGGGGAKGAAQVGVLRAIEQAGIPIDYIAGTSIGSIVGGLYACGIRAEQLDTLFRSQRWMRLLTDSKSMTRNLPPRYNEDSLYLNGQIVHLSYARESKKMRRPGMIKGYAVMLRLDSLTRQPDSIDFDNLPIPFRCVAVDAVDGQEVVLRSGNLPLAMRSSMSIPGAYKPILVGDSTLLMDGGLLNNLPVDVVRDMGADIVIAVDLSTGKPGKVPKKMKRGKTYVADFFKWKRARPYLKKYNQNTEDADLYIHPDLKGYDALDFTKKKIRKMLEIGDSSVRAVMPQLQELRRKIYHEEERGIITN